MSVQYFHVLSILGEFHLRLRHLEKSLLQALNDVKGRILDDDRYFIGRSSIMMIAKNDLFYIVGCENSYHHGQNPINWLIWSVYPQMSSPPQLELKIRGTT